MNFCKKCLFPDTKPDLFFDADGICDSCTSADRIHGISNSIDWNERKESFAELLQDYRGGDGYNCIVPVSGGKDSTWQVYAMKNIHGMKPLAVTFDQFDQTEIGEYNLKILREIGVDHMHFTLNPLVVKKLVRKGFEIVGDPYWVNHVGMFTVPFKIAAKFDIKLVVYGENPQLEYGGPEKSRDSMIMDRRWRQEFAGMRGFREEDMIDDEISSADIDALRYPTDEEVSSKGVKGIFYGHFHKWDAREHIQVCKDIGWKPLEEAPKGSWVDYENCDMKFIDLRENIKFLKYGYGRATDQLNIEIRNRRISREDALTIVRNIDGDFSTDNRKEFCDYIGITEKYFMYVVDGFANTDLFKKTNGVWLPKFTRN
jgi:N-acetyl sugar amidotransferase